MHCSTHTSKKYALANRENCWNRNMGTKFHAVYFEVVTELSMNSTFLALQHKHAEKTLRASLNHRRERWEKMVQTQHALGARADTYRDAQKSHIKSVKSM